MDTIVENRVYLPTVEKVRVFLMAIAILYTYGIHPILGNINGAVLSFVFPALFIISGYLVLWEGPDPEKQIVNTIKRTALCFGIMAVVYFVMSYIVDPVTTLTALSSKRAWFDFVVLNVWPLPVGSIIWYVQSLLYAYIIIFFLNKLKLLKFDIFIAGLCLVITLLVGELASVVGFNFLWHGYIGGNFLTRALPYILIGCFIGRKEYFFGELDLIHYVGIALVGSALSAGEYLLLYFTGNLIYVNHLFGMGVLAVAICIFAFYVEGMELSFEPFRVLTRAEIMIPFFVCSPIYAILVLILSSNETLASYLGGFIGIITLVLSFLVLLIYSCLRWVIMMIVFAIKGEETGEKTK